MVSDLRGNSEAVRRIIGVTFAALTLLGSAAVAPGARETTPAVPMVTVRLKEFKVIPLRTAAKAGKIAFVVRNVGKLAHDFVVLKTNLPPGGLPSAGNRAREVGRVGRIPAFRGGQTRTLTLTLKRGKYVLICNVPGHYKAGMFAGFRAT